MTTSSPSPRLRATQTILTAFKSLSARESLSIRTPDCTQIFAPSSLAIPGKSSTQFAEHLTEFVGILKSFPVTAKEIVENPTTGQVTVWATSDVKWREEVLDLWG